MTKQIEYPNKLTKRNVPTRQTDTERLSFLLKFDLKVWDSDGLPCPIRTRGDIDRLKRTETKRKKLMREIPLDE